MSEQITNLTIMTSDILIEEAFNSSISFKTKYLLNIAIPRSLTDWNNRLLGRKVAGRGSLVRKECRGERQDHEEGGGQDRDQVLGQAGVLHSSGSHVCGGHS